MNKPSKYIGMSIFAILLTSCETTTQMTSGEDYLSRYKQTTIATDTSNTINSEIRDIAAIEPDLRFPARIGLARIERGQLTNSPTGEMQVWGDLVDKLGAPYGEFVPVSPFIAEMVRPNAKRDMHNYSTHSAVADIRRASARQHLDYVLVYEVNQNVSDRSNALSLANLTILGLYVIPTRNVKINATANAILIDVRNGYPYGTASAYSTDKKMRPAFGAGTKARKTEKVNYLLAVENLTGEVEVMMKDLWVQQSKQ